MIIKQSFGSYNDRRYGKPWGAKVSLSGIKPQYDFCGSFDGTPGSAGNVRIEAEVGDVLAFGQKDFRGNNTENDWYLTQEDGSLKTISRSDAIDYLMAKK